jgi:hypothetical protein
VSETEKKDKDIGGKRGATVLSGGDKNDKLPSATLSVQQYLSRSRYNLLTQLFGLPFCAAFLYFILNAF